MMNKKLGNHNVRNTVLIGASFLGFAALNQQEPVHVPASAFLSASADVQQTGKWGDANYTFDSENGQLTLTGGDLKGVNQKDAALQAAQPSVKKIVIQDNVKVSDASNLFAGFTAVQSYEGLDKLDLSGNKHFDNMFINNSSLTSIDVSFMKDLVKDATVFSGMFAHDTALQSVNLTGWQTAANAYQDMFYDCQSLESLDLSGFDMSASNVNVHNMLYNVKSLKHLVVGPKTKLTDADLPDAEWKDSADNKEEDSDDLSAGTWDFEHTIDKPAASDQPASFNGQDGSQPAKSNTTPSSEPTRQPETNKQAPSRHLATLFALTSLSAAAFLFINKKSK